MDAAVCPHCTTSLRLDATGASGALAPTPVPELRAGDLVGGGRFVLLKQLGRGGMGVVWQAVDRELGKTGEDTPVALKFLSEQIRADPRALDMMRTEVLNSRRLRHHHIVSLYELYVLRSEVPFVCMEYVDGENLGRLAAGQPQGVLRWAQLVPLVKQLCDGLDYAHREGVIHRDLKPGNLMVDRRGNLKLTDFGLAKIYLTEAGLLPEHTRPRGTLPYMSPQQLEGNPPRPTDDIYSLGATLYDLLTGTPPFTAREDGPLIEQVRFMIPESIPQRLQDLGKQNSVPGHVKVVVAACLEKDPRNRPQAVKEVGHRLALAAAGPVEVRSLERTFDGASLPPAWKEGPAAEVPQARNPWLGRLAGLAALLVGMAVLVHPDVRSKLGSLVEGVRSAFVTGPRPKVGRSPEDPAVSTNAQQTSDSSTNSTDASIHTTDYRNRPASPSNSNQQALRLPQKYRVPIAANQPARVTRISPNSNSWWTVSERLPALGNSGSGKYFTTDEVKPNTYTYKFELDGFQTATRLITVIDKDVDLGEVRLDSLRNPLPERSYRNSLGMVLMAIPDAGYWVAAREITVANYREFCRAVSHSVPSRIVCVTAKGWQEIEQTWEKPGFDQTDAHPVVGVSWHDAMAFCEWLTRKERALGWLRTNQHYRLPTDAQWSAAAGTTVFPYGNQPQPNARQGNYSGLEARRYHWFEYWPTSNVDDGYPRTAPVGSFEPNPLGFFDLGGNVAEWCLDWYTRAANRPEVVRRFTDLQDQGDGQTYRIVRGASWYDSDSDDLRTDTRQRLRPDERNDRVGFRVVLVEDDSIGKGTR